MKQDFVIIRTDGGSRGNPGPAGIGFEILLSDKEVSAGAFIGETTNNVAEYSALIWALKNALSLDVKRVHIQADSQLMIRQLSGVYKVKAADLKPLWHQASELLKQFEVFELTHIPRELNKIADARANEAMDMQHSVGEYCIDFDSQPPQMTLDDIEQAPVQKKERTIMAGTYSLTVKDHFDAAHNLYDYPGECRNLHGHTWDVEVTVVSKDLDALGLVCDFKDLKLALKEVLSTYDHTYINKNAPFDEISPTAENLARIICERLSAILPSLVKVKEVAVWESPIARVGFSPD